MNTYEYLKRQYPSGVLRAEDIFAESLGAITPTRGMKIEDFVDRLNMLED